MGLIEDGNRCKDRLPRVVCYKDGHETGGLDLEEQRGKEKVCSNLSYFLAGMTSGLVVGT